MTTKKKYERYSDVLQKKYGRLSFGRLLRSWRLADEMTLAQFARRLSISAANLSDLEQGRRIPSPSRAAKIALELGLPEIGLIQLAIEDSLLKEGLKYEVRLEEAA